MPEYAVRIILDDLTNPAVATGLAQFAAALAGRTLADPVPTQPTRTVVLPPLPPERIKHDPRVPKVGSTLIHRGRDGAVHAVRVTAEGFDYEGNLYGSVSAAAKAITGNSVNGYLFFGLK